MSYERDKDAYTRHPGAIAAIDASRMRQRQKQRVAMRSAAHDARMGNVAMYGGLGMVNVGGLTGQVRVGSRSGSIEGGSGTSGAGGAGGTFNGGVMGGGRGGVAPVKVTGLTRVVMGAQRLGGSATVLPGIPDPGGPTTPTGSDGSTTITPANGAASSGGGGAGVASGGAWVDPSPPTDTGVAQPVDDGTTTALVDPTSSGVLATLAALSMPSKVILGAAVAGGVYLAFFRKKR